MENNTLIEYGRWLVEWALGIKHWNTLEGWILRLFVWIICTASVLWVCRRILELLVGVKTAWEALGLPYRISEVQREQLVRRQQFARVLSNDLTTLGKAENWNDQAFTDLEAQVEADGHYYPTTVDRLLRRPQAGVRRVPSLMRAIETGADRIVLLIGDPGSGKSVALRHLAQDLADRAAETATVDAPLPLYINLKELPNAHEEGPTADFIKQFVFDNVRRGDADTADYLREHWEHYRGTGQWFFLFDSFDEIPAVLHAGAATAVVHRYSEAIRQFLEGMSSCRAIVASREFKSPQNVVWPRLRILELSEVGQRALVDRSFLAVERKKTVKQHLATSETSLHRNPMFLNLLCRFVKEDGLPPANDFALLDRHISKLAFRDGEYVAKHFGLSGSQVFDGAIRIARLFAEHSDLSLAPTFSDIAAVLDSADVPGERLDNLLAALLYVKIGRSDVPSVAAGDRRFTFAHRRYQEALFVRFIAQHPDYLRPSELLTDARWREYTVTLLQTQPVGYLQSLLAEAVSQLTAFADRRRTVPILQEFGGELSYFRWDDQLLLLLELLAAGLSVRCGDIPTNLQDIAAQILLPAWEDGDLFDRAQAVRFAVLLAEKQAADLLTDAVRYGTNDILQHAFDQAVFLRSPSDAFSAWVRRRLSDNVLTARTPSQVLKLEAISGRLPPSVNGPLVVQRAKFLRRSSDLLTRLFTLPVSLPLFVFHVIRHRRLMQFDRHLNRRSFEMIVVQQITVLLMLALATGRVTPWPLLPVLILWLIAFLYGIRFMILYAFRDSPADITILNCIRIANLRQAVSPSFLAGARRLGVMAFAAIVPIIFVEIAARIGFSAAHAVALAIIIATFGIMAVYITASRVLRQRRYAKSLQRVALKQCRMATILHAQTTEELVTWAELKSCELLPDSKHIRSFGRVVVSRYISGLYNLCTHRPKRLFMEGEPAIDFQQIGGVLNAGSRPEGPVKRNREVAQVADQRPAAM